MDSGWIGGGAVAQLTRCTPTPHTPLLVCSELSRKARDEGVPCASSPCFCPTHLASVRVPSRRPAQLASRHMGNNNERKKKKERKEVVPSSGLSLSKPPPPPLLPPLASVFCPYHHPTSCPKTARRRRVPHTHSLAALVRLAVERRVLLCRAVALGEPQGAKGRGEGGEKRA